MNVRTLLIMGIENNIMERLMNRVNMQIDMQMSRRGYRAELSISTNLFGGGGSFSCARTEQDHLVSYRDIYPSTLISHESIVPNKVHPQ